MSLRILIAASVPLALAPSLLAQDAPTRFAGLVRTAVDTDRDGVLSLSEIEAAVAAVRALDKDQDGKLSREELGMPPSRRGGMRFRRRGQQRDTSHPLDTDRNGELSAGEISNASKSLRALDGNRDGRLSKRELATAFRGVGGSSFTFRRGGGGGQSERKAPEELEFKDGAAVVPDRATFDKLAYQGDEVLIDTHLANWRFVKFQIQDTDTEHPVIYFINTKTHRAHMSFMSAAGIGRGGFGRGGGGSSMRGVLVYRPLLKSPNGQPGLFTFEFEPFDSFPFHKIKLAHRMLQEKSPILRGRLAYHPLNRAIARYGDEKAQYDAAKLPVVVPKDLYVDIAYLPLHEAQSFGRLRLMQQGERPGVRDIVVYRTLPNEMPRVAGVMTAVRQTPLSHVNLRAIQDNVPNAFISGIADDPRVKALIGKYVYYGVDANTYELREATVQEVDAHFLSARPKTSQVPERDLGVKTIRSLDEIGFADWKSVGVKAANLAMLRKLDLPAGIVPKGYAVPFSFYDEFMKQNDLHSAAAAMRKTAGFATDTKKRSEALAAFRKRIVKGKTPPWIKDALSQLQKSYPATTRIRCRSSTNNEDLPAFSGAGLYDSFSHKPGGGHLVKTIKRVWASLWTFRAYEEREFHRIDHGSTAMGVLVHPSYTGELANGVAVSADVVYQTKDSYYVNTQVGEDMVTNPQAESIPEEVLLHPRDFQADRMLRPSNRVKAGRRLLNEIHLDELRECLGKIERKFRELYGLSPRALFSIEVEFKVTPDDQVAIKQARPWLY